MKRICLLLSIIASFSSWASPLCDLAPNMSNGVKVIEFKVGDSTQSKIPYNQFSISTVTEELTSLQEMDVCGEKVIKDKCVLRFEKLPNKNIISMIRGNKKWLSWNLQNKQEAQEFVIILKKTGFCS
jgi:hypothetical protein